MAFGSARSGSYYSSLSKPSGGMSEGFFVYINLYGLINGLRQNIKRMWLTYVNLLQQILSQSLYLPQKPKKSQAAANPIGLGQGHLRAKIFLR